MIRTFYNKHISGREKFQKLFLKLAHIAKYGKNIGSPIAISDSGELEVLKFLLEKLPRRNEFVFIDVGANEGIYSQAFLDLILKEREFKFHLFEPQKELYERLMNRFKALPNIIINQKGVGSFNGEINLYRFNDINTLSSVYPSFKGGEITSQKYDKIEITRLDDYFNKKGISNVDFIKIDIEGHELEALKGLGAFLKGELITAIQFEFGSFNISSRTYFNDFWNLLSADFSFYRVLKDGLYPIKKYSVDLEVFDTTNYLLIAKKLDGTVVFDR